MVAFNLIYFNFFCNIFSHNKYGIPTITQDFPLTKKLSAEDLT